MRREGAAASGVAARAPLPILGVLAVLVAAIVGLFWPTIASLLTEWRDTATLTYTHGYLVAMIGAWLLLRERAALSALPVQPDYLAAVMLGLLSVSWLIAYRAGLQLIHQVLLPVIGWLVIRAALGAAVAKRCGFAFGYLYFAIPIWSVGNLLLQDATVWAVRVLLRLAGISAYVVNNVVHIPAGVFEIAGGCSGLHFFIVASAIAALYGELQRDSLRVRVALLALAAAVAMLSNWIRVFTIIVAGHLTDMQHYLVRVDHYYFGWIVFALGMVGFFVIARHMPLSAPPAVVDRANDASMPRASRMAGLATALIALGIGPAWSMANRMPDAASSVLTGTKTLPVDPGVWRGPLADPGSWQPRYPGADVQQRGEYRGPLGAVSAFTAVYSYQRQGREMIGFDNSLLGDSSLEVTATGRRDLAGYAVNELELSDAQGQTSVLWYYYRVGSRRFSNDLLTQLYYGIASLVSAPSSRLIALQADCGADCGTARRELTELLQAFDEQAADAAVAQN